MPVLPRMARGSGRFCSYLRTMKFHLIAIVLLLSMSITATAQNRVDKPFEVQVNLNGLFMKSMGKTLTKKDVITLKVKDYSTPGFSIGYHLNSKLFVGYAYHPNRNLILSETYSFDIMNVSNDILIEVDHNTGTFHTLNGRFFPFSFGLYASFFFTHVTEASYKLSGTPIDTTYSIAGTPYGDALNADWNFKDLTTFGVGLGYDHVSSSGFSFNLGIGIPIEFTKDLYENIKATTDNGNQLDENDIIAISEILQDESFYFPLQIYTAVGWNF